jgi:divalent metal cation (Fe/Co/Zn/Cd) transporter
MLGRCNLCHFLWWNAQKIRKRVEAIKDVRGYHQLSVRMTGKRFYVEMHVLLDSNLRFEDTHRIASSIEMEVKSVVPNARATIHTEPLRVRTQPSGENRKNVCALVKQIAEGVPRSRGGHNIRIQEIDGKLCVDLHLEVSANMTVKQAHDVFKLAEKRKRAAIPDTSEITVHMESASERISRELTGFDRGWNRIFSMWQSASLR